MCNTLHSVIKEVIMKQTKTIDLGNFNVVVVTIEDDQTLSYSVLRHDNEMLVGKSTTVSALCYEVHKYLLSDLTYSLNPLSTLDTVENVRNSLDLWLYKELKHERYQSIC